ncbi:MAG: hypothetical protein ABL964_09380 [Steroidobacteraceae bacterium]
MAVLDLHRSPGIFPFALREELHRRQPVLAAAAEVFLLVALPCVMAMVLDPRELNGVSVWLKPAKFAVSFFLYYATLAWAFGYLPASAAASRSGRLVVNVALVAGSYELLWIIAASSLGVPSHFNRSGVAWTVAYAVAGVGAMSLMIAVLVQGVMLARDRSHAMPEAFRLSWVLGACLAFVGTVISAGFLSQHAGHWVGGIASDAGGVPLFHWSRTGGDLRVPHFWALHAQQILPLAGVFILQVRGAPHRSLVIAAAVVYAGFVAFTFVQALQGRAFLG